MSKDSQYQYYSQAPVMPPQALHSSKKTKEWAKKTMEAIEGLSNSYSLNGRSSAEAKQVNYNLLNNIFDPKDFKYVYDQFNLGINHEALPARFRNINLIADKVSSLKGEELQVPFDWVAIGVGGEIINSVEEKKKEVLTQTMAQLVRRELGLEPTVDEEGNTVPPPDPERVLNKFNQRYRDTREINTNRLLQILFEKLKLKEKFNAGWEHALIASEEIYYVGLIGNKPDVREVNPIGFEFDKSPSQKTIEDSEWAREERWLSVGQIIDEYGEELSDAEIKKLESGQISNTPSSQYFYPGFAYQPVDLKMNLVGHSAYNNQEGKSSYIRVVDFAWKSRKKIGFVRQVTEEGEVEEAVVGDDFKLSEEQEDAGVTVTWRWINTVYMGTKIGSDIYTNIEESPYQHRSLDDPSECKLPYVGRIYNNTNSKATSFVDMLKPHQYMYNTIWYRLEDELAKAKGKAVIMDLAQLPRSEGMDVTEWIQYLNNAGIMFINSFEEGEGMNAGKTSAFNQFTEIDRAASQVIGQYINILTKIEQLVDKISGITPQRQGATSPSETATGVERAIQNSNTITAPLFFSHDLVKQQVLNQLIGVCRVAYSDGTKGRYFMDESYPIILDIDGTELSDSDYGVFIVNGAKHKEKMQNIEQAAVMAVQASTLDLQNYVKLINSPSFAEKLRTLEEGEVQSQQRVMQLEEQKNQALIAAEKEKTAREQMKEDREDARHRLTIEARIQEAQIRALGFAKDKDFDKNKVPDVLEVSRVNLDREKLNLERQKHNDSVMLKEKEIEAKKLDARNKLKVAKENKNKYDK